MIEYPIDFEIEDIVTNGLGYHEIRKGLKERLLEDNPETALQLYLGHLELGMKYDIELDGVIGMTRLIRLKKYSPLEPKKEVNSTEQRPLIRLTRELTGSFYTYENT